MDIAVLVVCSAALVLLLIVTFLVLRTFAGVHILASRQSEDPARLTDSVSKVIDQRISSMEENLTRVEKDQQETTRKHNEELNNLSTRMSMQRFESMNNNIVAVLKTDKERNTALLEGNSKLLATGMDTLNKSMETRLSKLTETFHEDFTRMRTENNQQLEKMRETVNEKLDKTLNEQFEKSFKGVLTQMTELQKSMGELKGISNQVGSLEKTLNGVKTRGILGEVQLKQIIADVLTPQQYDIEVPTKPGSTEHVEIAIRMPLRDGDGFAYLPIDSKCHLDRYETLIQAYDSADKDAISRAKREFGVAIREDARAIAEKYISVPDTTAYAILFVPFEGMYSEIVNLNLLEELNQLHITVAGPYTLMAILSTVTNYFQALAIEKKSHEIERTLGSVKKEFGKYEEALEKVKKSLDAASNNLENLRTTRTNAVNRALRSITELDDTPYLTDGM
ncbi:MAG: DNA recombination protein RmuC [Clostridiales bacterium]|nr:DNA recombination protein RmuC [Clostridiales bacterium]MBR4819244.1 DNA recombination protein RmuC [Clostridiales bacterium]MBR5057584.1 DNA recombination protein RmuC [Clostridiales bacterium]